MHALYSFTLKWEDGMNIISSMMSELRNIASPFEQTIISPWRLNSVLESYNDKFMNYILPTMQA